MSIFSLARCGIIPARRHQLPVSLHGETGETPPVADAASPFRVSGTIGAPARARESSCRNGGQENAKGDHSLSWREREWPPLELSKRKTFLGHSRSIGPVIAARSADGSAWRSTICLCVYQPLPLCGGRRGPSTSAVPAAAERGADASRVAARTYGWQMYRLCSGRRKLAKAFLLWVSKGRGSLSAKENPFLWAYLPRRHCGDRRSHALGFRRTREGRKTPHPCKEKNKPPF